MNNSVLITGGAGFIGSNFVKFFTNKYPASKIYVLDLLTYAGNLENLAEYSNNNNFKFIHGDIKDKRIVDELINKVNIVINFAAETFVDKSISNPEDFVQTDIIGTYTLLEAAKKYKIDRFIQISTDEVYGSIEMGKFTELMPLKPNNPYSASKAGADLLALAYNATFGLPVIITRSSNNFGPNQFPEKLIPLFITNCIDGQNLPLYGDGLNIRDWIFVKDHCKGIDFALHNGNPGEIYNIGGENEKTNIDITKFIIRYLSKNESIINFIQDRPGHDRRYALDISKLSKMGWKPEFKFEEALEETINWYKNNESWWRPLKLKIFTKR